MRRPAGKDTSAIQAASAIFAEYGDFILKAIRYQAHGKHESDDLFQEFYLALVRRPVPADVRSVKSYLYRAIANLVATAIRTDENYSHALKKYATEVRIFINNEGTKSAFVDEEQKNAVVACLVRLLRGREAEAFLLRFRDGCSHLEIATKMRINKRTVSRYLSQSLRKLQRRLVTE